MIVRDRRVATIRAAHPDAPLRIGMLAPPWLAVPPGHYGGTELVLDVLSRGLQARGHDVVLFTVGASTCTVPTRWLYETADPDRMGNAIVELRHAAAAYDAFEDCDIVHDHTLVGLFVGRARAGQGRTPPIVTTSHGPFDDDLADIYRRARVPVIAISHDQAGRAPVDVDVSTVIHHGLDIDRYPFDTVGGDHLVALGRMNPTKGVHLAIDVARRTGHELLIAAKMREPAERRYFEECIRPKLGGGIEYVGEVDHEAKVDLLRGAKALINPIQWPEPFGLVMIESLACGTPVVSMAQGAAPEIVRHGVSGFLGDSVADLADGVERLGGIDRARCRATVAARFSMDRMAAAHEAFYRSVLDRPHPVPIGTTITGTLAVLSS